MIIFLFLFSFFTSNSIAGTKAFILVENGRSLIQEGNCDERSSPCSTFKIPLSIMGYDAGFFSDETNPEWTYDPSYGDLYLDVWNGVHTPTTWMKNSVVWFSQVLTRQLGEQKFLEYVQKFAYGNEDISGDFGKNNGLTNCWLSSSLKISPKEQILFLEKLIHSELPVTKNSQEYTRKILYVDSIEGWNLYGKTGTGRGHHADGSRNDNERIGWFVGWLEKDDRKLIFAHLVGDTDDENKEPRSFEARRLAKERLRTFLISESE